MKRPARPHSWPCVPPAAPPATSPSAQAPSGVHEGSRAKAIAGEMGRPRLCWRGRDGVEGACAHRLVPRAWRALVGPGGAWRGLAGPGHQDGAVAGSRGDSHHWPLRRWRVAAAPSEGPFTLGLSQAGALLRAGVVGAVLQTGFTFEAPTLHSQIFVVLLRCVADLFLLIF